MGVGGVMAGNPDTNGSTRNATGFYRAEITDYSRAMDGSARSFSRLAL